ncbi:TIGR02678 family protein [Actinocrispum wychmicini]|uniref:Uncharacterized protein (TIGR02678 family) n=1 Tax=Actinocrispum wychmicini TaxID=1213861 RepID=A0A4R2J5G0_9PSEU|nr:TIGR02678 family protein [Actinocrispum wychmicini]TCO53137.1 uncharacterized protein (TIGR02678 family) [Actinocrispum wychmicini]
MNTGPAGTEEHDANERRLAARTLLMKPIITAAAQPDQLVLVRKHATQLKKMFMTTLGYQLVVESTFARLLKSPLSQDTPARPVLARSERPFTAKTYTYLSLVCASLLSSSTGDQVLMSTLVEQIRADAVTAGVTIEDTGAERRHLVYAIMLLVEWGVLIETDGTVAGWETRQDEALLDVHRPLLPNLLARSLQDIADPGSLVDGSYIDPAELEQPRRSLRRKLVENPLIRREDLTDAERDVLSRERRELTRVLDESFGLTLEARAEGVLAYDTEETFSDVTFPGIGTVPHAALLVVNALTDDLNASATDTVLANGRPVPGVLAPMRLVQSNIELLVEQYGSTFSKKYTEDPVLLQAEVVRLLESVSLARNSVDGLILHPACARYRPEPQRAPARTQTVRGQDQESLFPEGIS